MGSSSSGSNSAPVGLDDGGNVLNIFTANWGQGKVGQLNNPMKISTSDTDINYIFNQVILNYKIRKNIAMNSLDNHRKSQTLVSKGCAKTFDCTSTCRW